jgi:hypothetical protein
LHLLTPELDVARSGSPDLRYRIIEQRLPPVLIENVQEASCELSDSGPRMSSGKLEKVAVMPVCPQQLTEELVAGHGNISRRLIEVCQKLNQDFIGERPLFRLAKRSNPYPPKFIVEQRCPGRGTGIRMGSESTPDRGRAMGLHHVLKRRREDLTAP